MDGAEIIEGCGSMGIRLLAFFEGFQCALEEIFGSQEIFFLIGQHPHAATTLNNLGAVHENLGEFDQAELRYRNSLAVIETIQGPHHPDIAMGLNNLASLYFSQQLFKKAEPLWQRALGISERTLGDKHPHLVQTLVTLGIVTHIQRKFDQAEVFYIRAIRITEHSLNPEHPRLISLYTRYGSLLRQSDREEEATVVDRKIESLRSANTGSPENLDQ